MTFPNLSGVKKIALDLETHDPCLKNEKDKSKDLGANAARSDSYILGAAIATQDKEWYFPFNHPNSQNVKLPDFIDWFKRYNTLHIVGHNIPYDHDFIYRKGNYIIRNPMSDTMINEVLLNENKGKGGYSLDVIAKERLGKGKVKGEIERLCEENGWKGDPRKHLAKMTANQVAPYGCGDARETYDISEIQLPLLRAQNLMTVYDLECRLIHVIMLMKRNGFRIDKEKIPEFSAALKQVQIEAQDRINQLAGWNVSVTSPIHLKKLFDQFEKPYFRKLPTEKMLLDGKTEGNVSFDEKFLDACPWEITEDILIVRKNAKIRRDYIEGLEKFCVGDRIHCSIHQVGARSGRMSHSNPNLGQIPKLGIFKQYTRALFIPSNGKLLAKGDYSGIEYYLLGQYANLKFMDRQPEHVRSKARELLRMICEDENYDPHKATSIMTGIEREQAKTINYLVMFGGGIAKLGIQLGISYEESKELLYGQGGFHDKLPFLKVTMNEMSNTARQRGYIRTALGRRSRLIDRFYRGLNRVIQGTAAEIIKTGLVIAYEYGLYGELDEPDKLTLLLPVHDETVKEIPKGKKGIELLRQEKRIYEHSLKIFTGGKLKLKVPMRFKQSVGKNWYNMENLEL